MTSNSLNNSSKLMAFTLKRDKFWLPIWLIAVIVSAISFAPLFPALAETKEEIAILAETMKSPVMVALTGPIYGDEYTYGIMFIQTMLVWLIILVAIMNIFFVVRHTRKDEEDGRIEILRSLPVGKASNLFSVTVLMVAFNLIIAIGSGFGLYALKTEGMDFKGCILFGFALGACGIFFAVLAMLFAQLSSTSRGSTGFSIAVLGCLYLLRAYGDLENDKFSLLTPFGLAGRVQFFYKNDIWPLLVLLTVSVVVFIIAFLLNTRRDLGASLLPERNGREHAPKSLNGPFGLSFRLVKGTIIAWGVTILIFAASYGSVFGDLTDFYNSNELFKAMIGAQGNSDEMMNSMVATLMLIMALIAVVPAVSVVLRLKTEAKKGRLEQIYALPVSKSKNIFGYFIHGVGAVVLMQALCVIGIWGSSEVSLKDPIALHVFVKTALNFMPPMLIFAGLAVFLIGVCPKATSLVWYYLVFCFVMSYIGNFLEMPKWAMKISVFGIIAHYPAKSIEITPIILLLAATCILTVIGIVAYRKRDLSLY